MARPYLGGSSAGIKSLEASATLDPADSGKMIFFTPPAGAGALVVTLPSVTAGLELTIVQDADYDTAACTVDSAEGSNMNGHVDAMDGSGGDSGADDDQISFGSATVKGDFVKLVSDGTSWYVVSGLSKVTLNGVVFA